MDIGTETFHFKEKQLAKRILRNCRAELYRAFPYLDLALAGLKGESSDSIHTIATDGERLLFSPEYVIQSFMKRQGMLERGCLHILLHCLYGHVLSDTGRYEEARWKLACDLAVEWMLDTAISCKWLYEGSEHMEKVRRECGAVLRAAAEGNGKREARLGTGVDGKYVACSGAGVDGKYAVCSAEQIYGMLERGAFPCPEREMAEVFSFDDHALWRKAADSDAAAGLRKKWETIRTMGGVPSGSTNGTAGMSGGSGEEELSIKQNGTRDYRSFLRQFAVPREELTLDPESFDYIYYSFGMERYGNIPLIEPLEYREVNRLAELVIAIDTSGSCRAETVERFLAETYRILEEKENFFEKMTVYLIQCDCCIQDVKVIHSREEWLAGGDRIRILGRGGTDFRPVFRYVEKLRERKELKDLRALIYFTDGDGIYPEQETDYRTAFVSVKRETGMKQVPKWIQQFCTLAQ